MMSNNYYSKKFLSKKVILRVRIEGELWAVSTIAAVAARRYGCLILMMAGSGDLSLTHIAWNAALSRTCPPIGRMPWDII